VKATRQRVVKFSLGNFEMYEVTAGLEYDTDDMTHEDADGFLDDMMREDVNRAEVATSRDRVDNDTSVYVLNEIIGGK
jgi:hypothetical protein